MNIRRLALRSALGSLLSLAIAATASSEEWVYNVEPGDSVWKLSHEHLKDPSVWDKLRAMNGIEQPRKLPIGSRLVIPREWLNERPLGARLERPTGSVQVAYAGTAPEPALAGDLDQALNAVITTGDSGRVSVILGDGSTLDLGPDSRLSFVRLTALGDGSMSDIEVRLESGSSVAFFPSTDPNPGRFLLWTKPAVTSVRGTSFRVAVEGEGDRARTEVVTGGVIFAASGSQVDVPASFGSAAKEGMAPVPPRPLLAAPDLGGIPARIVELPVSLAFPEVDEAKGYRVRVARDRNETSVFVDRSVEVAALESMDLDDGHYVLRARAIDEIGLEGLEAIIDFEIDARPLPPVPTSPVQEGRFRVGEPVRLAWTSGEDAVSFDVEVASDPGFESTSAVASAVAANEIELDEALDPGRHYWRVSAKDRTDDQGLASETRAFDVVLPPGPVALEAEEGADGRLNVRWPAQDPRFVLSRGDIEDRRFRRGRSFLRGGGHGG